MISRAWLKLGDLVMIADQGAYPMSFGHIGEVVKCLCDGLYSVKLKHKTLVVSRQEVEIMQKGMSEETAAWAHLVRPDLHAQLERLGWQVVAEEIA